MPMQASNNPPLEIPIDTGNRPDWVTRLGFPYIRNLYVGDRGFLYSTAALQLIAALPDCRAVHFTTFGSSGGFYIVVTNTVIYRVNPNGAFSQIATISFSGLPVQIDENLQNQITIVDGALGYVFDQRLNTFTILGPDNGVTITGPCTVLVLNTFTIIGDSATGTWIVSDTNNALVYPPLDTNQIPAISTQLTKLVSFETLDNNLYIFGLTGIERWQPSYNVNPFLFPFTKDTNFRKDIGTLSTNGVIRGIDAIYFVSNLYIPMALTGGDVRPLAGAGMARIISQYPDVTQCISSYYSFRGNEFCHMTFPLTQESWVFNVNSKKWAFSDDHILGADRNNEFVIKSDGLYKFSFIQTPKRRIWVGERMTDYKGISNYRDALTGFEVRMVQGLPHQNLEYLELTLSIDSESWLNTVNRPIGATGKRNAVCTWGMNLAAYEFTPKVAYYGAIDLTIEKITCQIK